jgi:twitching motility two-component system response regulator PilG
LRHNRDYQQLPIIMLTASVLDEDRVRAQAAGATDFLTKPISSWELLHVVEQQLALSTISLT